MAPRERTVTLDGLGPLSNPAVFRVYASAVVGGLLYVYIIMIASGMWPVVAAYIVTLISTFRILGRFRQYKRPPAATVDWLNLLGGSLIGATGAFIHFAFTGDLSAETLLRVGVATVVASTALLGAVAMGERRSLRDTLFRE